MLRKILTLSVVLATIVWTMGIAAFVPVASAATLVAGDLIKAAGPAVYYYAADGKRYTFPTESTYFSWYGSFSGVKTITADELAAIDLAGNIVVRPGTKLIKITTVPKVFAVEPNGKLVHVATEAAAKALYGDAWGTRVIDVPDGFWTNYTDTGRSLDGTAYPAGQLVKKGIDISYINADGKASLISESALALNRWKASDAVVTSFSFTAGSPITGYVASLADSSQGGGAPVVAQTGGALTIALASDTPAAQNIPAATSTTFLKFNLTAGSNDVSVSSIKLTAGGLGTSTYLDEVTLYANGEKVGTSKDVNSDRYATFNFASPVVITAGTMKQIVVKAKVEATKTGYYQLGIAAGSDILSNASALSGTFPVNGNTMNSVGDSVTLGELTFTGSDNDSTAQVGEDDVNAAEFTLGANSVEDIYLEGLTLKNNGNLRNADAGIFTLFHNGTSVATGTLNADKYVSFAFDAIKIEKGNTDDFKVTADFEGGSNVDTLQLYLKDDADVNARGANYGYLPTIVKSAFDTDDGDSTTITLGAGELTINFDKTAVPASNIKIDTDNIVVAKLTIKSNAEAVRITGLDFGVTGTGYASTDVENAELVDLATGGIIDLNSSYATTEEIDIAKGETKTYNFRFDTTATAADTDVYYVTLADSGITAEGDVSGTTITDITPASITGSRLTVVASALTHTTKTLNDQTIVDGATDVSVYKGELKTANVSDIKISKVVVTGTDSSTFNPDDVTEAKLIINNTVVKTLSGSKITTSEVLTFDGFTYVIPAGKTYLMYVKLSFGDTIGDRTAFALTVTEITAKDAANDTVPVTEDSTAGPTITAAANGYFDVTISATEAGANHNLYVAGGTTSGLLGALKLDAQKEAITLKDLKLMIESDSDANAGYLIDTIKEVQIVDSNKSTVLVSSTDLTAFDEAADGDDVLVFFDDWNYVVAESGVKTVYLRVVLNEFGPNAGQLTGTNLVNKDIVFQLGPTTAVVAEGGNGELTMAANADPSSSDTSSQWEYQATADTTDKTNTATTSGIRITSITNDLSNGTLTNSGVVIGKFKFAVTNNGNMNSTDEATQLDLATVSFTLNSSGVVLSADSGADDVYVYWASNPTTKVTITDLASNATTVTAVLASLGEISGEDTLVVELANLTGAGTAGDFVQLKLSDLDGGSNFKWDDGIASIGTYTKAYLDYTYVNGGTLSN